MRISTGQRISLICMVTAVDLVFLFAAGMFGIGGYVLLTVSSVAAYALTCEKLYREAVIAYILVTAIGLLIVPETATAVAFAGLFGHYPLFKSFIDTKIKNKITALCIKLLYCNAWLILAIVLLIFVFNMSTPEGIPMPKWAVVAAVEAALIATEYIHTFSRWLYVEKLRSGIVPRR